MERNRKRTAGTVPTAEREVCSAKDHGIHSLTKSLPKWVGFFNDELTDKQMETLIEKSEICRRLFSRTNGNLKIDYDQFNTLEDKAAIMVSQTIGEKYDGIYLDDDGKFYFGDHVDVPDLIYVVDMNFIHLLKSRELKIGYAHFVMAMFDFIDIDFYSKYYYDHIYEYYVDSEIENLEQDILYGQEHDYAQGEIDSMKESLMAYNAYRDDIKSAIKKHQRTYRHYTGIPFQKFLDYRPRDEFAKQFQKMLLEAYPPVDIDYRFGSQLCTDDNRSFIDFFMVRVADDNNHLEDTRIDGEVNNLNEVGECGVSFPFKLLKSHRTQRDYDRTNAKVYDDIFQHKNFCEKLDVFLSMIEDEKTKRAGTR